MWRIWDCSRHFLSCLCVQPYLFPRQLRFCRLLCRGSSSPARFTVWPATFIRWIGIRFTYPHFQKDYSFGVNDVLSISQRLLWQARTSHGCIKPWWLLISKLLNPQPDDRDALGLITVYPRPDEHRAKGRHRKYFPYFYYTIKAADSQGYTWIYKYSGLPVHAFAQTGKPLTFNFCNILPSSHFVYIDTFFP